MMQLQVVYKKSTYTEALSWLLTPGLSCITTGETHKRSVYVIMKLSAL